MVACEPLTQALGWRPDTSPPNQCPPSSVNPIHRHQHHPQGKPPTPDMRPALQHAARSLTHHAALTFFAARPSVAPSSVCFQCKLRAFSAAPSARTERTSPSFVRQWSSTARRLQEKPPSDPQRPQSPAIDDAAKRAFEPTPQQPPHLPPSPSEPTPPPAESTTPPQSTSPPPKNERIEQVPDEKLPSHRQGLRWEIYKRTSAYFDELLPKLILVGQKVNSYTGTDFSGIEALRQEIKQQGEKQQSPQQGQKRWPLTTIQSALSNPVLSRSRKQSASSKPRRASNKHRKRKSSVCWSGNTLGQPATWNGTCL